VKQRDNRAVARYACKQNSIKARTWLKLRAGFLEA